VDEKNGGHGYSFTEPIKCSKHHSVPRLIISLKVQHRFACVVQLGGVDGNSEEVGEVETREDHHDLYTQSY